MSNPWPRSASLILSLVNDGVLVLDRNFRIQGANDRFHQWTGFDPGKVLGRDVAEIWEDSRRWEDWRAGFRLQGGSLSRESLELRTVSGDPVPVEVSLSLVPSGWGRSRGAVLVLQDQRPSRLLAKLVKEDALTGVLSRAAVLSRFEAELVRAQKFGTTLGLILMDVDGFQGHNDRWGPSFGDQVLRVAGAELRESVRASGAAGRLGSDEFLVLLPQSTAAQTEETAQKLRTGLAGRLFAPQDTEVPVTASFGAALVRPTGIETVTSLLARVDDALERAQSRGRNRVELSL